MDASLRSITASFVETIWITAERPSVRSARIDAASVGAFNPARRWPKKRSFLAERPLGYVVSSGLKVLALAIVVSGARTIFDQLQPSANPDIYEALTILVAALLLAMLAIFIPNLASALVTGGPALGAGAALTSGLAVAGAGALVAGGVAG
ncbi:type IV secretion system protein, partial [Brevundimonas sp.]|uniref:type IV secretion system protein n=1 Tax=Brevundimonas sp. TaxID=1871086 RepID=UPI0025C2C7C4